MSLRSVPDQPLGPSAEGLIGREAELAEITALLVSGTRIVSVVGPAGVGKTKVATETAERLTTSFAAYVVIARVGSLTETSLVVDEVQRELPGAPGLAMGLAESLWERCHGRDVLLVLDDVGLAPGTGRMVDEAVATYPGLRVLATGLRALGATGERVLRLRSFALPEMGPTATLAPAVALFEQTAVAADAGFRLGDHNLGDVVTVCRQVGGLPLAIQLAASRSAAIPVGVMARQLARPQGIGLLRDGTKAHTDRHASMERALDWTYDLLDDDGRRLLDQLSVFEGSFDLEAALHVTTPRVADAADMLDHVSGLVDLQLLDLDPRDPDHPRFALPRLVRGYAMRRLARSGGGQAARSRHAHYFQARCHRPVEPELLPDILAALDRAVVAGHVDEALHAAVAATSQASRHGAARVLQDRIDVLVTRLEDEPTDPVLLARALIRSATGVEPVVGEQSYAEWTAARVQAAVAAARGSGDRYALLEALVLTVRSLPTTMDAPSAFAAAAEGLDLARELADEPMIARFEMYAAMVAMVRGDEDACARMGTAALRRARMVGDLQTELHCSMLLHRVPRELLSAEVALASLEDLLAACEQAGESRLGGSALAGLAARALDEGDLEAAARWAYRLQLVAAEWRLTEPLALAMPLVTLVSVAAGRGDLQAGVELTASLKKFHSVVAFALTPGGLARYEAAAMELEARADPDQLRAWQERGAGLNLAEAHDHALAYARSVLARPASTASPVDVRTRGSTDLTPRETDVLREMASGATNREIGERLGMSVKTVMHHSVAIYRKLGVRGRGEATAWAFRAGLVTTNGSPRTGVRGLPGVPIRRT